MMSIFSTNKNKRHPNQYELDKFLSSDEFNSIQEEEINFKFGHLTGNGTYFCQNGGGNKVIIHSNGTKYYYLRKQVNNKNTPILYFKINDNNPDIIWNNPENKWNYSLFFDKEVGVWREPTKIDMSAEDEAMLIVDSVIMSIYKAFQKKKVAPSFEKKDWGYTYYSINGSWNIWVPTKEQLLDYCKRYDKHEFEQIILQYYTK